jgi:hypothetical protein
MRKRIIAAMLTVGLGLGFAAPAALPVSQGGRTAKPDDGPIMIEGRVWGNVVVRWASSSRQIVEVRLLRNGVQRGVTASFRLERGRNYGPFEGWRFVKRICPTGEVSLWVTQVRLITRTSTGQRVSAWGRSPGRWLPC